MHSTYITDATMWLVWESQNKIKQVNHFWVSELKLIGQFQMPKCKVQKYDVYIFDATQILQDKFGC